jgi:uncharacterized membrane protein
VQRICAGPASLYLEPRHCETAPGLLLTLIKFGWRFEVDLYRLTAGVIFVIGMSMIALAALIWLPRWAMAGVALITLGGHNLLDGVS